MPNPRHSLRRPGTALLLGLICAWLAATGCSRQSAAQVSYLGPTIEGVRQIHLVNPDGTDRRALFAGERELGAGLVWLPDGGRLVLFAGEESQEAFLADLETETLGRCLSCGMPEPTDLAFSPDGTQLALGSSDGLYLLNLDGTGFDLVSTVGFPAWIQWLPDGERIGFSTFKARPELYELAIDTREVVDLTSSYDGSGLTLFAPRWSPDGNWIAMRTSTTEGLAIQVMRADGTQLTKVADWEFGGEALDPGLFPPPEWSPTGDRILFTGNTPAEDSDIFVVNRDGSGFANLTNGPGVDTAPAWSPDGRHIAFVSSRDGNREIYVMNADGSDPVNVSNSPQTDEFSPAWRPRG